MALTSGSVFEFNASATANMVNGGGFNPANANFISNFTTDTNTANTDSPILSSASYNFVAGDVGAWVYVQSGTNWTVGYYEIASVASNKATLKAAIGEAIQFNSVTGDYELNTVAGCATVGTPTSGTCGIDFSQGTAAIINGTDLASTIGTTDPSTVTSAGTPFSNRFIGNIIHVTAGTSWTAGWYEIVSVSGTTATLDRAVGSSATLSSGTFYVGGALSLNSSLDDAFFEKVPASARLWANEAGGVLMTGQAISVGTVAPTASNPAIMTGYKTYRGDNPTGTNRPTMSAGGNAVTLPQNLSLVNFILTTTSANGWTVAANGYFLNCKVLNTSTTANRTALACNSGSGGLGVTAICCEATSQNGTAIKQQAGNTQGAFGCYFHDSANGSSDSSSAPVFINCIFAGNTTSAVTNSNGSSVMRLFNCTVYGRPSKVGIGANLTGSGVSNKFFNNIFSGLVTGISSATLVGSNFGMLNNFYNNTTDSTNYTKDASNLAIDPQFVDVTEINGTTATTSGSVLTDSGADFSGIRDGIDFLHVVSGTGVTVACYLIDSHTGTTLTVNNALGTSSAGDVVYWILQAVDFSVGNTDLKTAGFPQSFPGLSSTGYPTVGALQAQGSGGGGGGLAANPISGFVS